MTRTDLCRKAVLASVGIIWCLGCGTSEPVPQVQVGGTGEVVERVAPSAGEPSPSVGKEAAPAETKPPGEGEAVWVRSGKAPTFSMIKKALREIGKEGVKILGKPLALGEGRFVAAVYCGQKSVLLLVLSEKGGAAQLEGMAEVPIEDYWSDEEDEVLPSIAAWKNGDLDKDGEPEAWMVIRYGTEPMPAVGMSTVGVYVVLDPDPEPTIAFRMQTQILPQASVVTELRTTVTYKDADGDGHPDMHLRAKECADEQKGEEWQRICNTKTSIYYWNESDKWIARDGS